MANDRDAIAQWLLEVCRDLGVTVASVDEEILDHGANSLTIMKIIAKVEGRYGLDALPPEDLFEDSRITVLAGVVDRNRAQAA